MKPHPVFAPLVVLVSLFAGGSSVLAQSSDAAKQLYEVRTYELGPEGDEKMLDAYLGTALLPALQRQGVKPVGAFSPSAADENDRPMVILVIPIKDAAEIARIRDRLAGDAKYQDAAKAYLALGPKNPPYARIHSELLVAMDCWPSLKVPEEMLGNDERVYELRLYESPNERLGDLKVHMFNNGEVPIFLDCGITPLFIGQGLIGPQTPNLTYLTVYPNDAARLQAWKDFRSHPQWQVLKVNPKYAGTVSKIDKFILSAKPYSQM